MNGDISTDIEGGTAVGTGGVDAQPSGHQAISIVLYDSNNKTLHGSLNFTVWRQEEEVCFIQG